MITKEQAMSLEHYSILYHVGLKNKDGTAIRVRVNGQCKTWKTRPKEFRLPVKHGLYGYYAITHRNAHEWLLYDPTIMSEGRIKQLAAGLGMNSNTPWYIVADKLEENGAKKTAQQIRDYAEIMEKESLVSLSQS